MPFIFNAVDLCIATINDKPWMHAMDICKAMEYGKATKTADIANHLC